MLWRTRRRWSIFEIWMNLRAETGYPVAVLTAHRGTAATAARDAPHDRR